MSTTQSDRLRALLDPIVTASGVDLEDVQVVSAGRRRQLIVIVDADGGVPLDVVAEVSRDISKVLDDSEAMGGAPYVLEVTSPGVDRPLTEPRHYRRALGRLVRTHLAEGGELTARIVAVDDDGLDLEVPGVKGRRPTRRRLGFSEVVRGRVEVEFHRKAGEVATSSESGRADEAGDTGDAAGDQYEKEA